MHMLKDLLQGVEVRSVVGDKTVQVTDIEFDSRKVKSGSLFFATRGTQVDGHTYIPAAIAAGAGGGGGGGRRAGRWLWCAKSCQQSGLKVSLSYR